VSDKCGWLCTSAYPPSSRTRSSASLPVQAHGSGGVFHLVPACSTLFQLSGKKLERTPLVRKLFGNLVAQVLVWPRLSNNVSDGRGVAACCSLLHLVAVIRKKLERESDGFRVLSSEFRVGDFAILNPLFLLDLGVGRAAAASATQAAPDGLRNRLTFAHAFGLRIKCFVFRSEGSNSSVHNHL